MKNPFHFPTKERFHAFLIDNGIALQSRARALHAAFTGSTPKSSATPKTPAPRPNRAALADAARRRIAARDDALYAKVAGAQPTPPPAASNPGPRPAAPATDEALYQRIADATDPEGA